MKSLIELNALYRQLENEKEISETDYEALKSDWGERFSKTNATGMVQQMLAKQGFINFSQFLKESDIVKADKDFSASRSYLAMKVAGMRGSFSAIINMLREQYEK